MKPKNDIVARVKKLLALAEDQKGRPEGELAAEAAHRLMRKHALTELEVAEDEQDAIIKTTIKVPAAWWRRQMVWSAADHCGCAAFCCGREMTIYGRQHEIELTTYLAEVWTREIDSKAKAYVAGLAVEDRGYRRTAGYAFRRDAAFALDEKLKSMRKAAAGVSVDDAKGTALIVSRSKQADAKMRSEVKLVSGSGPSWDSGRSREGWAAGSDLSVSTGIGGSGTGLLTGG